MCTLPKLDTQRRSLYEWAAFLLLASVAVFFFSTTACRSSTSWYFVPSQYSVLPKDRFITRCCARLHAIAYRYLGEKTVHIKRCVLNNVLAAITATNDAAVNTVNSMRCCSSTSFAPVLLSCRSRRTVPEDQNIGPTQFETKVNNPTAITLYPEIPLYALDKSIDDIELDPPNAKNDACWKSSDVTVISVLVRSRPERRYNCTEDRRSSGMFVARVCVISSRLSSSWILRRVTSFASAQVEF